MRERDRVDEALVEYTQHMSRPCFVREDGGKERGGEGGGGKVSAVGVRTAAARAVRLVAPAASQCVR